MVGVNMHVFAEGRGGEEREERKRERWEGEREGRQVWGFFINYLTHFQKLKMSLIVTR